LFRLKFSFFHPSDSACGGRTAHRILATPLRAAGGKTFLSTSEQAYYPIRYNNTEDWYLWLIVCHPVIPYFVRR